MTVLRSPSALLAFIADGLDDTALGLVVGHAIHGEWQGFVASGRAFGAALLWALALYPVRLGFYYVFYPVMRADALWLAFPVSSAFAVVLSVYAYRKPGWREQARAVPDEECEEETHVDGETAGRMAPTM